MFFGPGESIGAHQSPDLRRNLILLLEDCPVGCLLKLRERKKKKQTAKLASDREKSQSEEAFSFLAVHLLEEETLMSSRKPWPCFDAAFFAVACRPKRQSQDETTRRFVYLCLSR